MRGRLRFGAFVVGAACVMCRASGGGGDDENIPLPGRGDPTKDAAGGDDASDDAGDGGADADAFADPDAGDACDYDKDGYRAKTCGGNDCDDDDSRAHPDAGLTMAAPTPVTNGDWDCDGTVERQYPTNTSCLGDMTTCGMHTGFTGNPACGATGPFVACAFTTTCSIVASPTVTQGCR